MTHPGQFVVRMGRALAGRRRLAAMGMLALVCTAAVASPGVRTWAWAAVGGSAEEKPVRIAAAEEPTSGTEVALPAYSSELDAQLGAFAGLVRDELVNRKRATPERADAAAQAFIAALGDVVNGPLTKEQFDAIASSLMRRHFRVFDAYPDITDLEIQQQTLEWVDRIRLYLARPPLDAATKAEIARQVEELLATVQTTMTREFNGRMEAAQIAEQTDYLRFLLTRDLDDPVMPVLKRPFSAEEMNSLKTEVQASLAREIAAWAAAPAEARVPCAGIAVGASLNVLSARVLWAQYRPPTLSPELMERMQEERKALVMKRAQDFDRLDGAAKDQAWQQRLEEERVLAQ